MKSPHKKYSAKEDSPAIRQLKIYLNRGKTKVHFHGRRVFSKTQAMAAGYHTTGPITYLATSTAIGVATVLTALYTTSYTVIIDGLDMGVVEDHTVVLRAIDTVEAQGQATMGDSYQVDNQVDFHFGLHLKSELSDSQAVEHYLYGQLEELGDLLQRYQISLNGRSIGIITEEEGLEEVLNSIAQQYQTEHTVSTDFVEKISVETVYQGDAITLEELEALLTSNTTGETTHTVAQGDTFGVIAYANDMSSQELELLNPDVEPNKLYIGDVLRVKESIPMLSVITTEETEYTQEIPCPVEDVPDNTIYEGVTEIREQGTPGQEKVTANVHYLNGIEQDREVVDTQVITEPTVTVRAVGTLERPKTASYGKFIWPLAGRISSYFGPRTLNGRAGYHSGLDIPGSYGATIVAADGGTVTYAGWRGGYGNLVIITHDSGIQTYYAHCSSITASVGQKVYRGQSIAKVGSTGNSTGNHLHFEVRVGGQAVNPMGYMP